MKSGKNQETGVRRRGKEKADAEVREMGERQRERGSSWKLHGPFFPTKESKRSNLMAITCMPNTSTSCLRCSFFIILTTLYYATLIYITRSPQVRYLTLDSCHCAWLNTISLS